MKKFRLETILVFTLHIGIAATGLTPFLISHWSLFPYIYGRGLFLMVLIEIMSIVWVTLILLYPQYRPSFALKKGTEGALNTVVLVFLAALMAAVFFSADMVRSFWGSQERMTGVFTMLHIGLFYFMFRSVIRTAREARFFLIPFVLAGIIVSAYVLYEGLFRAVVQPSPWFANGGFLGSFLLFVVFFIALLGISEYATARAAGQRTRALAIARAAAVAEIIVLWAVLINATRAVWVGLFIAVVVGVFTAPFFLISNPRARLRVFFVGAILAFVIIVLGALVVFRKMPETLYQKIPFFERATTIVLVANVHNERILSWVNGLRSWTKRPIFGYGPENYYMAHNRSFNLEVSGFRQGSSMVDFDKAHNMWVEMLATSGIVGFTAYGAIFLFAILLLFSQKGAFPFVVFMLLVAYGAHLFFTFDTPLSLLLFFASLVAARGFSKTEARGNFVQVSSVTTAITITALVIIMPLIIYRVHVRSSFASHFAAIAHAAEREPVETSFAFYYQALSYKPVNMFEIRAMLGMDMTSKIKEYGPKHKEMLLYVTSELEKNTEHNYFSQLLLGIFYNALGAVDKKYFELAVERLKNGVSLAPSRHQFYTEVSLAYFGLEKYQESYEALQRAFELGFEPSSPGQFMQTALVLGQTDHLQEALFYYEKARVLDQKNIALLGSIGALYKELGEKEKAREIAREMLTIDPSLAKDVGKFLEGLAD